jgi:hypothetical protein
MIGVGVRVGVGVVVGVPVTVGVRVGVLVGVGVHGSKYAITVVLVSPGVNVVAEMLVLPKLPSDELQDLKMYPTFAVAATLAATPGANLLPPPGQFGDCNQIVPLPTGDTSAAIATHAWKFAVTVLAASVTSKTLGVVPDASPVQLWNM